MKTLNKIIYAAGALLFMSSCSEDFLEVFPTETLSQEQVSEASKINPDVSKATLLGIYENLYRRGSGGTDSQEDFGITTQYIQLDMLSTDMAHLGKSYNRQTQISELTATVDPDADYNYRPWRFLFRVVNLSNLVIDGAGGNDVVPETENLRYTVGQAKALRGYAYFFLAHVFVNDISNLSQEALPIYTSAEDIDQPKSTLQEVFDLVIKDLTDAETLLEGFVREDKIEINQDIVRGLLAKTYGALNNWPMAEDYAELVVNSGNYPIMTADEVALLPDESGAVGGFNDINSIPGVMWGIDITPTGQGLASLFSWWGFMDVYSYSYAAVGNSKGMDADLHANFRDDDIRLNQFSGSLQPSGKFYYKGAELNGFAAFSGPQSNIDSDSHYMRIAEMYLLHAEAAAENGNDAAARTSLKALLDLRLDDSSYIDGLSGAALAEEAALQARLELFAEGQSYFIMKRRRETRTRGSNWLDLSGDSFNHDDERLTYEIPQEEILFNPNINTQN
ncbi:MULTISPECIES: RagB/SusD family nutrient uptake outer membrane protein [unclassified Cellulophaga]|uniref:RagB/SusD family nutrient uptake outer membrane protein n=1 Tax=unclassified Cellulophaga TaxID=2634405 RepID=UPI0026E290F6|nr:MULTISPECIES: RagB/SusD family nutrient uptake outer membrane protein [unclassified Cellulophaga]MDO6491960.1 RagB/SusD family nutrient uptake outer membrane protein [Cellulophaga sp. 2_MG-2023]MDO6495385.1 RagB/SusD family nutrient uptake outer membrane protein [Cellulophaga sp. 3_MG-2023]